MLLAGLLLDLLVAGNAQSTVIEQKNVSVSRVLAGRADIAGLPAEGISVDLCTSSWKAVLATTTTDAQGRFSFETPAAGTVVYLRLSADGVNAYRLRVKIKKNGPPELRIYLNNAT